MSDILQSYIDEAEQLEAEAEAQERREAEQRREQSMQACGAYIGRHGLGELLDALHVGPRSWQPQSRTVRRRIHLDLDGWAYPGVCTFYAGDPGAPADSDAGRSRMQLEMPGVTNIRLPAPRAELGAWLRRVREDAVAKRERTLQYRLSIIAHASDPAAVHATASDALAEFPGEDEAINAAVAQRLAELAAQAVAQQEAAAERLREETAALHELAEWRQRQRAAWRPFVVFEVRYGIVGTDSVTGEAVVETETVHSLRHKPDDDGWWPLIEYDGRRRLAKIMNVGMVQPYLPPEPDWDEVTRFGFHFQFCSFSEADGLWYVPEDALSPEVLPATG